MFPSEWREFPSAPCLAEKKKNLMTAASRCCWNRARFWHASELVSFLVGLRTYQHPGTCRNSFVTTVGRIEVDLPFFAPISLLNPSYLLRTMKSYTNNKTVRRPSLYYVISLIVSCREPNQSASVRLWYLHCTPPLASAVSCQISLLQLAILSLDEWKLLLMSKFYFFQCTVTATGC